MAPFAFLGRPYDAALHEFYTTTTTRDLFNIGSMLSILISLVRGDSLADAGPLAALIARHVDAEFLRKIADAHNRGRRLYIGTVDLDSQQFVVWNMGLIAASGRPEALELFRKVMFASASVPIAFPPVFFEVEADGRLYDEMHVDGAVAATVFLHGGVFRPSLIRERAGLGAGREDIFVIHNGQLSSEPSPTPRSLRGITARVIEASGRAGVVGALFIIYARRAARAGELSLGHDSPGCRDPRHRSLRPGEDDASSTRSVTGPRSPAPSGPWTLRDCKRSLLRPDRREREPLQD